MDTNNGAAAMTTTTQTAVRKEFVAVMHGQNGTIKIAYRNAAALAEGLIGQTKEGWMVAHVYERDAQTYANDTADAATCRPTCRTVTRRVNDDLCFACRHR